MLASEPSWGDASWWLLVCHFADGGIDNGIEELAVICVRLALMYSPVLLPASALSGRVRPRVWAEISASC